MKQKFVKRTTTVHDVKLAQVADRASWHAKELCNSKHLNVRRFAIALALVVVVQRGRIATGGIDETKNVAQLQNGASPTASLSPIPRNVHILWTKYIIGIGGRKPAIEFSYYERRQVQHTYSCRNVIWKIVDNLVQSKWLVMQHHCN
jgi:hypothetical protein